jgi:ATP-dependent DNA helicase RecG
MVDVEADWAERKESWKGDAPEKSRQAVCAFGNDLPDHRREGVLFVGVDDRGRPTGLPIDDRLLQTLADMKTDGKILPPPSVTVEKRNLKGAEVAVVHVLPSDSPPVRYEGRVWIRVGPRRAVATVEEERRLTEKPIHGDKPFDVRPCRGATLGDLELRYFREEYLGAAFPRDVLEANGRSESEQLAALKMIVGVADPTPTNLGLLALGFSPLDFLGGAYVQFLRIGGTELSDPIIDSARIGGRIADVIRRTEEKLEAHVTVRVDLISGSTEQRFPSYPLVALQQLLRNAVLHRNYESTNAPVRITWYDDRVEILSPGGPFGSVNTENFGRPGVTDYRNRNLAEALRDLGFIQRFGVGIATARTALEKNGNPPLEFEVNGSYVGATIRAGA